MKMRFAAGILVTLGIFTSGCSLTPDFISRDGLFDKDYPLKRNPYRKSIGGVDGFYYMNPESDFSKMEKVHVGKMSIVAPHSERLSIKKRRLYRRIVEYYQDALEKELAKEFTLVDEPGEDVTTFSGRISSVQMEFSSLKIYQYIPVGLALTAASRAGGFSDKEIRVVAESRLDNETLGEPMIIVGYTEVIGMAKDEDKVTAEDIKEELDRWARVVALRMRQLKDGTSKIQ